MKSTLAWAYGLGAYLTGFLTLLYFVGFCVGVLTPTQVDTASGASLRPPWLVDLSLVMLFGLQHSVMARAGFKAWLTRLVPKHLERSTYLLATSAALITLMALWQPLPAPVWRVDDRLAARLLTIIALGGWGLVLFTTFLISHVDLFGLRQIYLQVRGQPYAPVAFRTPSLYRRVRHPMQLGVLIGTWFSPAMTVGHLLLASGMTAYVLIGLYLEERDLVRNFGERYRAYQKSTPKLIPLLTRKTRPGMAVVDE